MDMNPFYYPILALLGAVLPLAAQQPQAGDKPVMLTDLVTGVKLWETTPAQLETQFANQGLQWLSENKDRARFFGSYAIFKPDLACPEVIADFQNGLLSGVSVSIFNRGDQTSMDMSRREFDTYLRVIRESISAALAVNPTERGRDPKSAVKANGWIWHKPPSVYLMEYSYVKQIKTREQDFRPEFIRLRVSPTRPVRGPNTVQPLRKSTLTANLTRDNQGDIAILNIPMVDQGPKGYCAVATAERIFRYYGITVDQHELAQIANTSEGGGTDPIQMIEALERIAGRMQVRVRDLQRYEIKQFLKIVENYNREAKRNSQPSVNPLIHGVFDIQAVFSAMDAETLKLARTEKDKTGYTKFQRLIAASIDKGIPVMWGVQLGLFPEPGLPQTGGGHMRLIIGYNPKTQEILYSDTWGRAHAKKRMPMAEACAMTTGLYYIEPIR